MKKNIAMRVAAFLFILTMISTCAFATTFAKYTTSRTATDSARVAKWGVEVAVVAEDALFVNNDDGTVVSADQTKNVVAPGTDGGKMKITISGTPEVDTEVTIDVNLVVTGWDINTNEFYCPLVFTVKVGDQTHTVKGLDYTDAAGLKGAIDGLVDKTKEKHEENTNLAHTIEISWIWAFSGSQDTAGTQGPQTDIKDTALGDLPTAPQVSLTATCTVDQVD